MQTNLYLIALGLSYLLTFSCNNSLEQTDGKTIEGDLDTLSFEEVEKSLREEQQAEIYEIKKRAVIFFMIDRQEAKKLARELGDSYRWETDMLFNGFINQTKEFGRLIRKHDIKSELIHNSKFQILLDDGNSIFFDRENEDQIMGEILTDGKKEPLIHYGMYQNRELAGLIQDFFGIENLGYVTPDTLTVPTEEEIKTDTLTAEVSEDRN